MRHEVGPRRLRPRGAPRRVPAVHLGRPDNSTEFALQHLNMPWGIGLVDVLSGTHRSDLESQVTALGGDWAEYDGEAMSARVWNGEAGDLSGGGGDKWHARVVAGTFVDDAPATVFANYLDDNENEVLDSGESFAWLPAADVLADPPTGYYVVVGSYLVGGEPISHVFVESP